MGLSVYQLKKSFQDILRPITQLLFNKGVTANQVTLAALLISVVVGCGLSYVYANVSPPHYLYFAVIPVWMLIRMAFNAIDGMLAREHHQASKAGVLLNELGDVIADVCLFLPFAVVFNAHVYWVFAVVVLAVISEMTGVLGVMIGADRRYEGPMGKSDRAVLFSVLGAVLVVTPTWSTYFPIVYAITILLLCKTIYNRAKQALYQANGGEYENK